MRCPYCDGSGWVISYCGEFTGAKPCECRFERLERQKQVLHEQSRAIDETDIAKAIATMAEVIPFFPQTPLGQRIVAAELEKYVNTVYELETLVALALAHMKGWKDGGLSTLRGMFCSYGFIPRDGVKASCEIPGFQPHEIESALEQRYLDGETKTTEQRLAEYRKMRELSPPEESEPLLLAGEIHAAKRILPGIEEMEEYIKKTPSRATIRDMEEELKAEIEKNRRTAEENQRILDELKKAISA